MISVFPVSLNISIPFRLSGFILLLGLKLLKEDEIML